jgi:outer membrane protein OmpA-like peptidoglycan-associated protein
MTASLFGESARDSDHQWMSVSDMMAGLMVIFMFILIAYIRPIIETRDKVQEIAIAWNEYETKIYEELRDEFEDDLPKWQAELERDTLTLRFKAPDVLFAQSSTEIRPEFEKILSDFFPRYVDVLHLFNASIEEIRIEGHTSSEWNHGATAEDAYFANMALSQGRTRSVLEYGLGTLPDPEIASWARGRLTANGMSSSRLERDPRTQEEDKTRSRRVEFRVVTDSKRQIVRIVETVGTVRTEPKDDLRP